MWVAWLKYLSYQEKLSHVHLSVLNNVWVTPLRSLCVSFSWRSIGVKSSFVWSRAAFIQMVLSGLVSNVIQFIWLFCCPEKLLRNRWILQARVLWAGTHVCGCDDIPGLWHCHPVRLPPRLPQSRGLREVPCRPGERGTEGRSHGKCAQKRVHAVGWRSTLAFGLPTFCLPPILSISALNVLFIVFLHAPLLYAMLPWVENKATEDILQRPN